jgi:hypothetical protein
VLITSTEASLLLICFKRIFWSSKATGEREEEEEGGGEREDLESEESSEEGEEDMFNKENKQIRSKKLK